MDYNIKTEIILNSVNDYVQFQNLNEKFSESNSDYLHFIIKNGKVSGSGNIQSLLNYSNSCKPYCFNHLFENCTSLLSTPEFPAIYLAEGCYSKMFYGCTSLANISDIEAMFFAPYCCHYMFYGCTSLINVSSSLFSNESAKLSDYCFDSMFRKCSNLQSGPSLPFKTLAEGCYRWMFRECSSIDEDIPLPALTLEDECYKGMFQESSVTSVELPASALMDECYSYMFYNCSKLVELKVNFRNWNIDKFQVDPTENWLGRFQH